MATSPRYTAPPTTGGKAGKAPAKMSYREEQKAIEHIKSLREEAEMYSRRAVESAKAEANPEPPSEERPERHYRGRPRAKVTIDVSTNYKSMLELFEAKDELTATAEPQEVNVPFDMFVAVQERLEHYHTRCDELDSAHKTALEQLKSAQKDTDNANRRAKELTDNAQALSGRIDQLLLLNTDLRRERDQLKEEVRGLVDDKENLQDRVQHQQKAVASANAAVEDMKTTVMVKDKGIDQLLQTRAGLEESNKELQRRLNIALKGQARALVRSGVSGLRAHSVHSAPGAGGDGSPLVAKGSFAVTEHDGDDDEPVSSIGGSPSSANLKRNESTGALQSSASTVAASVPALRARVRELEGELYHYQDLVQMTADSKRTSVASIQERLEKAESNAMALEDELQHCMLAMSDANAVAASHFDVQRQSQLYRDNMTAAVARAEGRLAALPPSALGASPFADNSPFEAMWAPFTESARASHKAMSHVLDTIARFTSTLSTSESVVDIQDRWGAFMPTWSDDCVAAMNHAVDSLGGVFRSIAKAEKTAANRIIRQVRMDADERRVTARAASVQVDLLAEAECPTTSQPSSSLGSPAMSTAPPSPGRLRVRLAHEASQTNITGGVIPSSMAFAVDEASGSPKARRAKKAPAKLGTPTGDSATESPMAGVEPSPSFTTAAAKPKKRSSAKPRDSADEAASDTLLLSPTTTVRARNTPTSPSRPAASPKRSTSQSSFAPSAAVNAPQEPTTTSKKKNRVASQARLTKQPSGSRVAAGTRSKAAAAAGDASLTHQRSTSGVGEAMTGKTAPAPPMAHALAQDREGHGPPASSTSEPAAGRPAPSDAPAGATVEHINDAEHGGVDEVPESAAPVVQAEEGDETDEDFEDDDDVDEQEEEEEESVVSDDGEDAPAPTDAAAVQETDMSAAFEAIDTARRDPPARDVGTPSSRVQQQQRSAAAVSRERVSSSRTTLEIGDDEIETFRAPASLRTKATGNTDGSRGVRAAASSTGRPPKPPSRGAAVVPAGNNTATPPAQQQASARSHPEPTTAISVVTRVESTQTMEVFIAKDDAEAKNLLRMPKHPRGLSFSGRPAVVMRSVEVQADLPIPTVPVPTAATASPVAEYAVAKHVETASATPPQVQQQQQQQRAPHQNGGMSPRPVVDMPPPASVVEPSLTASSAASANANSPAADIGLPTPPTMTVEAPSPRATRRTSASYADDTPAEGSPTAAALPPRHDVPEQEHQQRSAVKLPLPESEEADASAGVRAEQPARGGTPDWCYNLLVSKAEAASDDEALFTALPQAWFGFHNLLHRFLVEARKKLRITTPLADPAAFIADGPDRSIADVHCALRFDTEALQALLGLLRDQGRKQSTVGGPAAPRDGHAAAKAYNERVTNLRLHQLDVRCSTQAAVKRLALADREDLRRYRAERSQRAERIIEERVDPEGVAVLAAAYARQPDFTPAGAEHAAQISTLQSPVQAPAPSDAGWSSSLQPPAATRSRAVTPVGVATPVAAAASEFPPLGNSVPSLEQRQQQQPSARQLRGAPGVATRSNPSRDNSRAGSRVGSRATSPMQAPFQPPPQHNASAASSALPPITMRAVGGGGQRQQQRGVDAHRRSRVQFNDFAADTADQHELRDRTVPPLQVSSARRPSLQQPRRLTLDAARSDAQRQGSSQSPRRRTIGGPTPPAVAAQDPQTHRTPVRMSGSSLGFSAAATSSPIMVRNMAHRSSNSTNLGRSAGGGWGYR